MSFHEHEQEGGFMRTMRTKRKNGGREFHRHKASQNGQPRVFKTYEDRAAEAETAWQRWTGVPPLAVAREMIAEADLPEGVMTELSAAIANLKPEKLEEVVNSGKLAAILAELARGAILQAL